MTATRKRWRTDGVDLASPLRESSPIDFPPPVPLEYRGSTDSIIFQGPPPVTTAGLFEPNENIRQFPTFVPLEIVTHGSSSGGRQKSAGWAGSILLHIALVILVAILVVPTDFGRRDTQTLVMTIAQDSPEIPIPMMLVDEITLDESSLLSELEREQEQVLPIDVSLDIARPTIKIGGAKTEPGRSMQSAGRGSSGSFFGIEADGQDFVYIVDRSGSMNGIRYYRAVAELKRSVRELREDQRFFVVLFSNGSSPMFGGNRSLEMVNATEENKKKLTHWLRTMGAGGGTNPNSSLRMAVKLKPNAVFMLSDGEFTENNSKRAGVLKGGGDAISIAKFISGKIPIHAIAFEDPRSCANMKQLAQITGGEYRFVNSAGKTQSELIAEARTLVGREHTNSREMDQSQLARQFGSAQVSANAKRTFANLLIDEYEASFGKIVDDRQLPNPANLEDTMRLLNSLVSSDPRRTACANEQDLVAGKLSRLLHRPQHHANLEAACDQLIRLPSNPAAVTVLNRLADHFESLNLGEPEKAFARLRVVKSMHPRSQVATVCQSVCDRIEDQIIEDANRFIQNNDLASAIRSLRERTLNPSDGAVRGVAHQALRRITTDQLILARNASMRNDFEQRDQINEQLETGFANDSRLAQWRRELSELELNARRRLQRIPRDNASSGLKLKRHQLEEIVRQYPDTIAAQHAREQLEQLPKWEAARDKEVDDLMQMMDDTVRR